MKLIYDHWIFRYWPLKNFAAISFPPIVTLVSTKWTDTDPVLIKHESIHWDQVARVGALRFYSQYLAEWVWNIFRYKFNFMKAYEEISFEKEAYAKENIK